MQLIPAVDLLDGRCVRLLHGDFGQKTFYPLAPLDLATTYAEAGAPWLHVVDLAASRDGADADTSALFALLSRAPQMVQTGGGVRNGEDVAARLRAGAARVVIGSVCVSNPSRMLQWLARFGAQKLVAALDVRIDKQGIPWPWVHGWTEQGDWDIWTLLDELVAGGLCHLLCTDISCDGALNGPNLDLYSEIAARYPQLSLQASGGVSSLEDLRELKATGAGAVITGKALLEQRFSLGEALAVLQHAD